MFSMSHRNKKPQIGDKIRAQLSNLKEGPASKTAYATTPSVAPTHSLSSFAQNCSQIGLLTGQYDDVNLLVSPAMKTGITPILTKTDANKLFSEDDVLRYVENKFDASAVKKFASKAVASGKRSKPSWEDNHVVFIQPRHSAGTQCQQSRLGLDQTSVFFSAGLEMADVAANLTTAQQTDALAECLIRPNPATNYGPTHPRFDERSTDSLAFICLCSLKQWCVVNAMDVKAVLKFFYEADVLMIPNAIKPLRCAFRGGYLAVTVAQGVAKDYPSPVSIPHNLAGVSILKDGQVAYCESKFWSPMSTAEVEAHLDFQGKGQGHSYIVVTDSRLDLAGAGVNGYGCGQFSTIPAAESAIRRGINRVLMTLGISLSPTGMITKSHVTLLSKTGDGAEMSGSVCYSGSSRSFMKINPKTAIVGIDHYSGKFSSGSIAAGTALLDILGASRKLMVDPSLLSQAFMLVSASGPRDVSRCLLTLWSNGGWSDNHLGVIAMFYNEWCQILRQFGKRVETSTNREAKFNTKIINYAGIINGLSIDDTYFAFPNGGGVGVTAPLSLTPYIIDKNAAQREVLSRVTFQEVKEFMGPINCLSVGTFGGAIFPVFARPSTLRYSFNSAKFCAIGLSAIDIKKVVNHISAIDPSGLERQPGDEATLHENPNLYVMNAILINKKPARCTFSYEAIKGNNDDSKFTIVSNNKWAASPANYVLSSDEKRRLECRLIEVYAGAPIIPENPVAFMSIPIDEVADDDEELDEEDEEVEENEDVAEEDE